MYCQVNKYLLEKYATEDVITKAEDKITNFTKSVGMPAVQYFQAVWEMALRWGTIYNKPGVKAIFIDGIHSSICYSMHMHCGAHQNTTRHSFAHHATSFVKLQENNEARTSSTQD